MVKPVITVVISMVITLKRRKSFGFCWEWQRFSWGPSVGDPYPAPRTLECWGWPQEPADSGRREMRADVC